MSKDKVREVSYNKTNVEEALERQIVRNSEILQEHRQMIDELKSRMIRENHLRLAQVEQTAPKAENFDQLRYLVEDLINICDQAFLSGGMTMTEHDRVSEVRKKYESIMKGVRKND